MSLTITHDPTLPAPTASTVTTESPSRRSSRWPIFGIVAGVTGWLSAMIGIGNGVSEDDAKTGVDVIDKLDHTKYHISFVLGLVSIAALMVTAAAWRRWSEQRGPRNLAARTIAAALGATATINIVGTALAGSMAIYLPGGMDEGWLSREAIFVNYTLLDFGQLFGWWGAMVAAGSVAALAFRRSGRLLPRWMGVVSALLMLPAIAFAVGTGLPGFPGIVMPIWLVIISLGMLKAGNGAVDVD